jgi:hypothetical protein
MDIMTIVGTVLFALLFVSWLFLPHTKELSEKSLEFSQIAEENHLVGSAAS